jgi:predicted Mrr-cat superfamily restriction endonuclease
MVEAAKVAGATREELWSHVRATCTFYAQPREVGKATGQLFRFGQECKQGDYILYYYPPQKCVRICRITSGPLYRDFDIDERTDIWHYRKVEYPVAPIPVLDLYGSLKGKLLGPRMSFWDMGPVFETVNQIALGQSPHVIAAPDPDLEAAYRQLKSLIVTRAAQVLNEQDWEWLVVDYLKAQGAFVDERLVGGNRPIIDVEAVFDLGEFRSRTCRVQVKRYQGKTVDWPEIESDLNNAGETDIFCYVSVFGFSDQARQKAAELDETGELEVRLLEAEDFVRFLLGGKMRERLRQKLQLPKLA